MTTAETTVMVPLTVKERLALNGAISIFQYQLDEFPGPDQEGIRTQLQSAQHKLREAGQESHAFEAALAEAVLS